MEIVKEIPSPTICEFWTTRDEGEEVVKNDFQASGLHCWVADELPFTDTGNLEGEKGMWVGGMKV